MSESERRRRYRYDRVMIESARILDPQFNDAVVFLTGAQIELLRNVSEYCRRIETYTAEFHLGYYLTPTAEDYDDILVIVSDMEEKLMGNPNTIWGYEDRWYDAKCEDSSGGDTDITSIAVPAGYVYSLEALAFVQYGGVPCGCTVTLNDGTTGLHLYGAPAIADGEWTTLTNLITLKEDDTIVVRITGLPNGETACLRIWGTKMVVPE